MQSSRDFRSSGGDRNADRSSELPRYTYETLPSEKAIRLLRIDEYIPDDPYKLVCALQSFNLEDCPPYDALSYTWGPPLDTTECDLEYTPAHDVEIRIESSKQDGFLNIGRNLFEALVQVRKIRQQPGLFNLHNHVLDITPYIWVDAVCINQLDEIEKTSQVAIMGQIFAKAETVLVWPGEDDGTYDNVVHFHLQCSEPFREWSRTYPGLVESPAYWQATKDGYNIIGPDVAIREADLISLAAFYSQRRYFRRLWTCQEVALAKSAVVILGLRILPFEDLIACGSFSVGHSSFMRKLYHASPGYGSKSSSDMVPFLKINSLRIWLADWQSSDKAGLTETVFAQIQDDTGRYSTRLYQFLEFCRPCSYRDPRDRIFALLGMLNTTLPEGHQPPLSPDYADTSHRIYSQTMSLLLRTLPGLIALALVAHAPGDIPIRKPSWVPFLGLEAESKGVSISSLQVANNMSGVQRMYNSSGVHARPLDNHMSTETQLRLRGKRYGVVHSSSFPEPMGSLGAMGYSTDTHWRRQLGTLAFVLETYLALGPQYWNGQSINEAIIETLTFQVLEGQELENMSLSLKSYAKSTIAAILNMQSKPEIGLELKAEISQTIDILQRVSQTPDAPTTYDEVLAFQSEVKKILASGLESASYQQNVRETTIFINETSFQLQGRCMLMTDTSVGLGPAAMRPGDEVWVLIPGRVPYILRPTEEEGEYLFVGEAYVHGIMFGEAVDGINENELDHVSLV